MDPVRVALLGAGPWAGMLHAPMLAAGPETVLTGVWARRPEAAAALGAQHGVPGTADLDEVLDGCEAVAICLSPLAQPDLALRAVAAGRHLLLEKPLAVSADAAWEVAGAAADAGLVTQMVLTNRYSAPVRRWLADLRERECWGVRAWSMTSAILGSSAFATADRISYGALWDVGPHTVDLAMAVLGPVESVTANGAPDRLVDLQLRHASGGSSQIRLSLTMQIDAGVDAVAHGPWGERAIPKPGADEQGATWAQTVAAIRSQFTESVRADRAHPLDARHGAVLSDVLVAAAESLVDGRAVAVPPPRF